MKITLTWPPGGSSGSFVIADSPAVVPMTNLKFNGERLIQQVQLYNATAQSNLNRGNRKTVVTFETTRQFTTQTLAESFLLEHETMFQGAFDVMFESDPSGADVKHYLLAAVMDSVTSGIRGLTTNHSYRIIGGIITTP